MCAVSYPVVTSTCAKTFGSSGEARDPKIVSLEPNNSQDVMQTLLVAGKTLRLEERYQRVVHDLNSQFEFIRLTVQTHLQDQKAKPVVAFLEWHDPFFTGGHWIADMMDIAGCKYTMCRSGGRSTVMSDDDFRKMDPDFILIGPCGFSVERAFEDTIRIMTRTSKDTLGNPQDRSWWKSMRAVKSGNVFALDGNSYYARPGPRLLQGCGIIARCVHGEEVGKLLGEDLAPSSGMKRITSDMYQV